MPIFNVAKFDTFIPAHRKQNYSISYGLLSCKTSDVVYPVVKLIFKLKHVDRWLIRDHSVRGCEILKQDPKLCI
jgi:hypothetical protein